MTSSPEPHSLAILGAGTFGLSTALAYRKAHPPARIALIDPKALSPDGGPATAILPASEDVAKIIRAAYASPVYAALGDEALAIWRTQPPYADHFHAGGWITANARAEDVSISVGGRISRARFEQAFPGSSVDEETYVLAEDEGPGWVDASRCLDAVREMAVEQGVEYLTGEAVRLLFDDGEEKRCVGVKMRDGGEVRAEKVVVAMGPWTPGFLRECGAPLDTPCEIAGVTALGVKLDEEQYARYKDMPILRSASDGQIMPPNRDRIMKINCSTSFLAPDISGREMSEVDSPYFDENHGTLLRFLPELHTAPIAFRRYCFDLVTMPSQDFIISPAPAVQGLYIAAGGSFHGWKFLPNIGSYVVRMIEGTLPDPWAELWRIGGTPSEDPIHRELIPKRPFV